MIAASFAFALAGVAFASLFHVEDSHPHNRAYNEALTAGMAASSTGFFWKLVTNHPRFVWMHDTIFKTIVLAVPHSTIIQELKGNTPPQFASYEQEEVHQDAA